MTFSCPSAVQVRFGGFHRRSLQSNFDTLFIRTSVRLNAYSVKQRGRDDSRVGISARGGYVCAGPSAVGKVLVLATLRVVVRRFQLSCQIERFHCPRQFDWGCSGRPPLRNVRLLCELFYHAFFASPMLDMGRLFLDLTAGVQVSEYRCVHDRLYPFQSFPQLHATPTGAFVPVIDTMLVPICTPAFFPEIGMQPVPRRQTHI